ncbi:MAG: transposase [Ignavibacteriales bacterium]|nr:transposase [Ignavibacteriales bacterium]
MKCPRFSKFFLTIFHGFNVKYALLDRGFYRKRILTMLLARRITVIIQGRKCSQTKKMIENYITGKGGRYCRGSMKLNCVKGSGQRYLWFDVLLVAKRKHRLYSIKKDYRTGALTLDAASKPIFPLIILFAHPKGISKLRGNETYIRNLYRLRWQIEIAFREMNKLGFSFRLQGRDARLSIQGAKSLLYNIWHVQRHFLQKRDPNERDLQLDGFLGKTYRRRHVEYILLNDAILQGMPLVIKLN